MHALIASAVLQHRRASRTGSRRSLRLLATGMQARRRHPATSIMRTTWTPNCPPRPPCFLRSQRLKSSLRLAAHSTAGSSTADRSERLTPMWTTSWPPGCLGCARVDRQPKFQLEPGPQRHFFGEPLCVSHACFVAKLPTSRAPLIAYHSSSPARPVVLWPLKAVSYNFQGCPRSRSSALVLFRHHHEHRR